MSSALSRLRFFIPHPSSLIPHPFLLLLLVAASSAQAFERVIDAPMYLEAEQMLPPGRLSFPRGAKELWLRALQRPEADMKCQAAQAISQAHRDGFPGFESTIPALRDQLDPGQPRAVRLAVAEALVTLEAGEAAERLFAQAQEDDSDMRELVEPALARWDHRPARALWLRRLTDSSTPPRSLLLAIRCLANVREQQAVEPLRSLVLNPQASDPARVEAARALGSLRTAGLEKDAERLAPNPLRGGVTPRLAAAALLRQHSSKQAVQLLQRLLHDSEPAVARLAAARLFEIDSEKLLIPEVEYLLGHAEPRIRLLGVAVLRRWPTQRAVRLLALRLADEHIEVRVAARDCLGELAEEEGWREEVLKVGMAALDGKTWQSQEQATVLLTQLDYKPAADKLLDLLDLSRPEVYITAAWGLRKLAVPHTLPAVLRHVEDQHRQLEHMPGPPNPQQTITANRRAHSLSQLNQFMGQQQYAPADAALRRFVAKPAFPSLLAEARAAAIWALGWIHEGDGARQLPLVIALEGRLTDTSSIPPEDSRIRLMSAFTLGRLKAERALPTLQRYRSHEEPSRDFVSNACGWAIEHMKGRSMPDPKPLPVARRQWFLVPLP